MAALRLHIGDHTVYEGPAVPVPRVGDNIQHEGHILPIEAVIWEYASDAVSVALVVGTRPYTF